MPLSYCIYYHTDLHVILHTFAKCILYMFDKCKINHIGGVINFTNNRQKLAVLYPAATKN